VGPVPVKLNGLFPLSDALIGRLVVASIECQRSGLTTAGCASIEFHRLIVTRPGKPLMAAVRARQKGEELTSGSVH
jgi:hypothetical protein